MAVGMAGGRRGRGEGHVGMREGGGAPPVRPMGKRRRNELANQRTEGRGPEKGEAMEKCEKKGKREEPLCAWD
jgi:hypothetical protein